MKKIYILLLSVVMSASITTVSAQTQERRVPRPEAPGVQFDSKRDSSRKSLFQKAHNKSVVKKSTISPAKRVKTVFVENDVAGYTPYDTLLLSKYTYTSSSGQSYIPYEETYTYDEYGHRQLVTSYYYDRKETKRYTYTIGDFNFWTSKTIETKDSRYEAEGWVFESKEERETDSFKRLVSQKIYQYDEESGKIYLYNEKAYDYGHAYMDDNFDGDEMKYGHEVKDFKYNPDGSIEEGEEYTWYEPAKKYLLTKSYYLGCKSMDSEFGEDCIKRTHYAREYIDSDSIIFYVCEITTVYYGDKNGSSSISFDYGDNSIKYCSGELTETLADTPQKGYKTQIKYYMNQDSCIWKPYEKIIYSGCTANVEYGVENVTLGTNYYFCRESYDNDFSNDWSLSLIETGEWQDGNILKTKQQYSSDTTDVSIYYSKYDADGNEIGDIYLQNNGGYILRKYYFDDTTLTLTNEFIYYDADNNELKTIVCLEERDTIYDRKRIDYPAYYIKENGTLKRLEDFTIAYNDAFAYKYTFTENGLPLTEEQYWIDNGEYFPIDKIQYSYYENGYKKESYYYEADSQNSFKAYLSEMCEYTLLDGGNYRETIWYYNPDGSIGYASREDETKDLINIFYSWNAETQSFVEERRSCQNLYSTTDDGIEISIHRYIDDNGNVVNSRKYESKYIHTEQDETEELHARYTWDTENNKWVGESKSYYHTLPVKGFSYKTAEDPRSMYDDEYLADLLYAIEADRRNVNFVEINYNWNYETDSWEPENMRNENYSVNGNILEYVSIEASNYRKDTVKYTITLNGDGYLKKVVHQETTAKGGEITSAELNITDYEYTTNNLLSKKTYSKQIEGSISVTGISSYEYANHTVYPTSIEDIYNDVDVQINGLNITCSENTVISLYDLSGCKVAEGTGTIDAPVAGKYIVKCNGKAFKIVITQ